MPISSSLDSYLVTVSTASCNRMHFGMVYGFSRMMATMGARVQAHVEWGHRKQSVGPNQLVSDLEPRNDRITSPAVV